MSTSWDNAVNLLCVRLDAIGDVVMTTPAIRALRAQRPDRRITLLTSPSAAPIASLIPEVDEVIVYEAPWMKATPARAQPWADMDMIERLRVGGFDGAVVFSVYSQNPLPAAMLCYLAGIPLRAAHCHENPYQLLTDWVADLEPQQLLRHEVRRQLDLVAALGCGVQDDAMSLRIPPAVARRAASLLRRLELRTSDRWALVHPGATAPSRRYSPQGYGAAARALILDHGFKIVFSGTEAEAPLIDAIRTQIGAPSCSLAGELDLATLCGVIARAPVLIVNNTGPAHIAAALGTPVVDLYALTNMQHTPWKVPSRVLYRDVPCRGCYKSICPEGHQNCLSLVPPEEVVAAALDLTQASTRQRREQFSSTATLSAATP